MTDPAARLVERARAKVNLALHVTGRRADGYHLLDSLVVFAQAGDLVEAEPAAGLSLSIGGPFGRELDAGAGNLVLRAACALRDAEASPSEAGAPHAGSTGPAAEAAGAALLLQKNLPVASGLGGGSADAAATLRLLARLWSRPLPPEAAMLALGADLPVCLAGRPTRMSGIGEILAPVALPAFWMVLVNPGVPVSTGAVFAGLAARDNPPMPPLPAIPDPAALFAFLAAQRNDLEAPATTLAPAVAEVLAALAAQPGCALSRMSGSGATCFGLFAAAAPALAAAEALRAAATTWWVVATPRA